MGNAPITVQFLVTEDGPDDFREFDANFNLQVEGRRWQWKVIPSFCCDKESESQGDAQRCYAAKKKKAKMKDLVQKSRALIFQIPDPGRAGTVNFELELPYKMNVPIIIFCANPQALAAAEVEAAVIAQLSPALRTTKDRVRVVSYEGETIPTAARNGAMDWLASALELPAAEGEEEYPEDTLSLVIVGSAHVGKTSLLQRYVNDEFNPHQGPTMGIDKFTVRRQFRLPGRGRDQHFILDIWDTAGEARYRTVTLAFYGSAHGFAVVFDVTQRDSFDDVASLWFDNIVQAQNMAPFGLVLVACKCDTPVEQWAVPREEILAFVKENELAYVETSAKDPEGRERFNEVFSQLVIRTADALSAD